MGSGCEPEELPGGLQPLNHVEKLSWSGSCIQHRHHQSDLIMTVVVSREGVTEL